MTKIKLGYEIGTGKEVTINPSHLIVTGITQLSGKTTTLEALIKRSGLKAIVFKTKIGEKSFSEGTIVPPFFRDRSDFEFVRSLIEAYSKEKLFLEKGTLMKLCKGSSSLLEIKKKVDDEILTGKVRGLKEEILTRLQHYLEQLIPQIQYANFSKTLIVQNGINIMNIEQLKEEAQSLVIQSVADEVLKTQNGVILVIPEAWKFLSQKYNNPCKRVADSFIRQGATNQNFVWIDSQDMAGVDKSPLKQISTWILGYQSERNEVKHTLDQIALQKKYKPKEDEIMTLSIGHFFLSTSEGMKKVYVQPAWMDDATALKIAMGKMDSTEVSKPMSLTPFEQVSKKVYPQGMEELPPLHNPRPDETKMLKKEIIEIRQDFFNKLQEITNAITKIHQELFLLKSANKEIDLDEVVSKVLQKMPMTSNAPAIDENALTARILARIPTTGGVVYQVLPLEKIRKDFLKEINEKIVSDVQNSSMDAKKVLKYLESRESDVTPSELVNKCFMMAMGGGSMKKANEALKELQSISVVDKTAGGRFRSRVKDHIANLMGSHSASQQEIDSVYNHVMHGIG